jgi:SAM-dependent methyltransferase
MWVMTAHKSLGFTYKSNSNRNRILLALVVEISKLFQGPLFRIIAKYCTGRLLDVGGRDFFFRVRDRLSGVEHWTSLEYDADQLVVPEDPRFDCLAGDGCCMQFPDNEYDAVVNVQVLEHVFAPQKMMSEMYRVLKPGGYAVVMVPYTSNMHMAPYHYQNMTRYWLLKSCEELGMDIVELHALGGFWRTLASRMLLFYMYVMRVQGWSDESIRRNGAYYVLLPFMVAFTIVAIPMCLLFSLGDLKEEANNYLLVGRKRAVGCGR